jgi:tetratricopeptide (TPR) repeat protein
MSRGAASRRTKALLAGGLLALAAALPARAQTPLGTPAGFEMTRSVQQSLKRLQELWLQWLGAALQDNPARESETLRSMQATARQLGFQRLPDLALGASARALQSAAEGDFTRARRALDAAEALDPGRPRLAFEAATVARRQGSWLRAAGAAGRGFVRLLFESRYRAPVAARTQLWLLLALLTAAALFVAVEAMTKGGAVYGDLQRWLAARMPEGAAHALALALLLGPAALPGGPAWLLLIWTVVLWGYGARAERVALGLVWLVLGLAPVGAAALEERLALAQSPPMRALDEFEAGELTGSLFTDLQVLRGALPEDPAVTELIADVHRTLGQWEIARSLYRQVLAQDGDVAAALLNLGADAFRKGDFAAANTYFQRATGAGPYAAAAWYNLSQSYSETYQFEDSRQALARARELDGARVDGWMQTPNPERVLTFNGGLARRADIAQRLRAAWTSSGDESAAPGPWPRRQAPIAAALAALAALVLHLARRGYGYSDPARWLPGRSNRIARWVRALVPALGQAETGEGLAAAANLLLLAALVTLPTLAGLGGDFADAAPLRAAAVTLAATGGLLYLALRVRAELGAPVRA